MSLTALGLILAAAALHATITVTGRVSLDKNFGAGYSYPLIVEEAKVVKK